MQRLFSIVTFAYAGLAAMQWRYATRWLEASPGVLWCGNAVSDPYWLLVSVVGPLSALCTAVLITRCVKSRRWPSHAVTALVTFMVTSGGLVYESLILSSYGILVDRIWWLPWR